MKEKIRKFLRNNSIIMSMFISLACIAIWDSMTALVIYAIIAHVVLLALIIGLWLDIKVQRRSILSRVVELLAIIAILAITKHWYILCISMLYMFMVFVYIYDEWKNKSQKD